MSFLDLLYPKKCLECQKPGQYLCQNCLDKLPRLTGFNPVTTVTTVFPYKGVIRKAILALKYKYVSSIAEELSVVMTALIKQSKLSFPRKTFLTPIPLHSKREKYRGFNQSAEVGRLLAEKMKWHFLPDLLKRKVLTASQTSMDRENRASNVQGVFVLNPRSSPISKSSTLILFDDVVTTGSTLNEAKKILEKAGFKKVHCLTIAGWSGGGYRSRTC